MKEIFKVGDTVYHFHFGKGKITEISISKSRAYPIKVEFKNSLYTTFAKDGRYSEGEKPSLSFTPYDLVNGGFSQKRPLPEIEVDTLVYVRDSSLLEQWYMKYFSHFKDDKIHCFINQKTSKETKETSDWEEYSLTNPLEK